MAEWKKYIEMTKLKRPQKIREEKLKRSFIDSLKKKKQRKWEKERSRIVESAILD